MAIDYSKINITLQQFQDISSGKYNAGEVKLVSETKLGKINHHVHLTGSNLKTLSHQEVLAIKNAFVKALSSHGVTEDEIARVRHDLGLSADTGIDKTFHERSLKPLTRQQVHDILERNAAKINSTKTAQGDRMFIATSAMVHGLNAQEMNRVERRNEINAALAGARGTEEHEGIALAEAVIAGDVDFDAGKSPKALAAQIRAQRDQILQRTKGRPDANREAVVEFRIRATGQNVRIPTGRSEAAFVRKLDEMLIRLTSNRPLDRRGIEVRVEFGALADPVARRDWLNGLGNAPDAGFKIRTAVVLMLTEAGIDDWETLSAVNRVDDEVALGLAKSLAQLNGTLRGDALRNDQAMQALANLAAPEHAANVPGNQCATIPATSPEMWNNGIRTAIAGDKPENLPHDIKALLDEIPGHVRGHFGEDAIGLHESGVQLIGSGGAYQVVPTDLAERATPESIRARVFAYVESQCAENLSKRLISRALVAAGGSGRYPGCLWSDWSHTRPELRERLLAARSSAEVQAIFDESREAIAADAKRFIAVGRSLRKVNSFLRDTLAAKLGVPPACLAKGLDLNKFSVKVSELGNKIRRGEIPAATDEEVEAHVRALAEKRAAQYADAIAAVERIPDIPPALRDALLEHVIAIDSPQKLDVAQVIAAARDRLAARAAAIDAALVPGTDKQTVYEAMRLFVNDYTHVLVGLFPQGTHIGGEEECTFGIVLLMTSILDREGFLGRLDAFFARPDVKNDDFYNNNTPAYAAYRFVNALPKPDAKATLASSLGTPDMPPFHARALMKAFEDADLGALPVAARMAVLRPSHPVGTALAAAIAAEPGGVSPARLRELATPILQAHVAAGGFALPPADAERMEAALAKYDGGLPAADRLRLRQYAESLDFSEAAAPASEKALAERLDEICGGGFFTNPASSASRRALAAGFTPEDLPLLALLEDLVEESGPTDDQAVEMVLDPQSDFRRKWEAALLSLTGNRLDRVATLSVETKAAAARAVLLCEDDADLLAIVTSGIGRVIRDGVDRLRTPAAIQRIIEDVAANLAEVREAAAGDPEPLAAGLELLKGLETRRAPAGYIKYMLDAARRAPLDTVSKLRRSSTPAEINHALLQLNGNVVSILSGRDSGGLAADGDTALACHHFLLRTMVSRLTESQRRSLRDALASQNAVQTVAFYDAVANGLVKDMPQMVHGVREHVSHLSASLSRDAGFLYGIVRRSLGEADANGQLPPLGDELNPPRIGGQAIFNEILATARANIDAAREAYLRRTFRGNSPASAVMRGIFNNCLVTHQPSNPEKFLESRIRDTTANALNYNIAHGVKQIATTQNFASTQFSLDRNRDMDVFLPGGTRLSTDPATAADELARFVTGRQDAAYAQLADAERTKVQVVMSLLTQESITAALSGLTYSLNPNGATTTFFFGYGPNGPVQTRSFHLERDKAGGITVRLESTVWPACLTVGPDLHTLGAGSSISTSFTLTLSAEKLNALGELDFATCDDTAANQEMRGNAQQKFRTVVNKLPPAFQFDLAPITTTAFSTNLN